jgi:hypothetical protein
MTRQKTSSHITGQGKSFIDAARALECDESQERFDAALKKVAAHKPSGRKQNSGSLSRGAGSKK